MTVGELHRGFISVWGGGAKKPPAPPELQLSDKGRDAAAGEAGGKAAGRRGGGLSLSSFDRPPAS